MKYLSTETPIVIVGAGISGLTLSILLSNLGKKVHLYEKRSSESITDQEDQRSFNLTITERGMKSFREIGLEAIVKQNSVCLKSRVVHHPGSCICNQECSEQTYGEEEEDRLYSISRSKLVRILYTLAKKNPLNTIFFDSEVTDVDKAKSQLIVKDTKTEERTTVSYELLIGADGSYSKIRNYLLSGEIADFQISYFDWFYKKFTISANHSKPLHMDPESLHVFPKKGALAVAIPNPDKSFSCIYCTKISDPSDVKSERAMRSIEAKFQNDFPHLYGLEEKVRDTFNESKISGLVSVNISKWVSENIVLVGDAAHAVFPFYGQGMNSALQDCRKLISCLKEYDNLSEVLENYQKCQKSSTDALSALCKKHFYYLQQGCASPLKDAEKQVNKLLSKVYPKLWREEYHLVSQTDMPYNEIAYLINRQQFCRKVYGLFLIDYTVLIYNKISNLIKKMFLRKQPSQYLKRA